MGLIKRKFLRPCLLNFKGNELDWKVCCIMGQKNWSLLLLYVSLRFSICKMGQPSYLTQYCSKEKMSMNLHLKQFNLGHAHTSVNVIGILKIYWFSFTKQNTDEVLSNSESFEEALLRIT